MEWGGWEGGEGFERWKGGRFMERWKGERGGEPRLIYSEAVPNPPRGEGEEDTKGLIPGLVPAAHLLAPAAAASMLL